MKVLDLGEGEGAFGFVVRDKYDHNHYMLLSFENLEEIIQSYDELKKQFQGEKK